MDAKKRKNVPSRRKKGAGNIPDRLGWYHELAIRLGRVQDEKSLKNAMDLSLAEILSILGASHGSIRIWPADKKSYLRAETRSEKFELCFGRMSAPDCVCAEAISSGQMILAPIPPEGACAKLGMGRAICHPINVGAGTGGIFTALLPKGAQAPDAAARRLVSMALDALGLAVENLAVRRRDKAMASDMETVSYIGGLIAGKLALKEMALEIVLRLGQVLEADEVNVIVYDEKRRELSFLATHSPGGTARERPEVYPLSDGMNSWIIKNRKPLLMTHDTMEECRALGIRHGGKPAKSWLGAPMIFQGKVVGVVSVQSYRKRGLYDAVSVSLIKAVANQCAVAVVNARLFEESAEREAEKERLYFSLTHDLLSLINPISGFARIVKNPAAGGETMQLAAASILLATEKITRFAEDILVYAKLKSGRLELDISRRSAAEALEQAIGVYSPEILARSIRITVNGAEVALRDGGLPALKMEDGLVADLDPAQMERVFMNLISNAVKHAKSSIRITLEGGDSAMEAMVEDDGEGAPRELCHRLFEEYYQAHKGKRGVGLGLPSVKRIIELHQGRIWIDSDTGKGFRIHFTWPRTLADRGAAQPAVQAL